MATPTDIQLKKGSNCLVLAFDDGVRGELSAEFLRVHSPSAEVQGHGRPILQTGKRAVRLVGAEAMGNYAIKLEFDDGHDSGLFSWDMLHDAVLRQDELWQAYLDQLAAAGQSRDPEEPGQPQSWTPSG